VNPPSRFRGNDERRPVTIGPSETRYRASVVRERKTREKKFLVFVLTTLFLATVDPTHAQQTGKILRIGYLDGGNAAGSAVLVKAFLQELNKLGWVEGKNFTIEYRFSENKGAERHSELAADLVRLKVDLIVVAGGPPAWAAKKATTTIPIVMVTVADPVGEGMVASLARPGGNVTAFSSFIGRAKYQKARDTQGRSSQALPSGAFAHPGSVHSGRTPA
jgi:ABC-type uncharacterized transport system substrate-binding protein